MRIVVIYSNVVEGILNGTLNRMFLKLYQNVVVHWRMEKHIFYLKVKCGI